MALIRRYDKSFEEFHRQFTLPQEDRMQHTDSPHAGGYRWFKSPNVVPIEYYRRVSDLAATTKRTG